MIPKVVQDIIAAQIRPSSLAVRGFGERAGMDSAYAGFENQAQALADIQAREAAMVPTMPQRPQIGGEEKNLLGLAKLFAIGAGIDPRMIAQEEQAYMAKRQAEMDAMYQQAVMDAQGQFAANRGALQGERIQAEAGLGRAERSLRRREGARSERMAREAEERRQQNELAQIEARFGNTSAGSKLRAVQELMSRGLSEDEAFEQVTRLSANETDARREKIVAESADIESRTKERDTLLPERVNLFRSQVGLNEERAKEVAEKTRLMPEYLAVSYARVAADFQRIAESARQADNRLGESARQFDERESRLRLGESVKAYDGEIRRLEGDIRKLTDDINARLGLGPEDGKNWSDAAYQRRLAQRLQELAAIVSNPEAFPEDIEDAKEEAYKIRQLNQYRKALAEAYKAKREMNDAMGETVEPLDPFNGRIGGQKPTISGPIGKR